MTKALERFRNLSQDAPRDEYFDIARDAIAEYYLADPANPYQQSGRSSGAARWQETRRCLVEAIHRSGTFMDIGCANGLLLETLIGWAREAGFELEPHGLDFVPELVDLARQRFPNREACFEVTNAFYWRPSRQYDFVRTNLEYVPRPDWAELVRRQYRAVAPGGRLIVCHYRNLADSYVDIRPAIQSAGFSIAGGVDISGVAVRWIDSPASAVATP